MKATLIQDFKKLNFNPIFTCEVVGNIPVYNFEFTLIEKVDNLSIYGINPHKANCPNDIFLCPSGLKFTIYSVHTWMGDLGINHEIKIFPIKENGKYYKNEIPEEWWDHHHPSLYKP